MLKNSDLSEMSLLSAKKQGVSAATKRNRSDFEGDYRQEIPKYSKNLNNETRKQQQSKVLMPISSDLLAQENKEKIMDSNLAHSSYNDVFVNELKQRMLMKSDQIQKCKRISEKVDIYLEQDEKYADSFALKDVQKSVNDEYECFDTDFYFFNSMPLPPSFHEYYEENKVKADARVMKGILPEINCVYLFIDKSLYLWKFMEDIGNADNMHSSNIYNPENDRNQAKVFSFGPYEEEIRAVNVCKPTAHVFIQADIKMVFIIGFATSIKLYNLLFDEKTIALESLEVTVKINAEIEMISCSKSGRIFYGCSNGKVKEIDYQESKLFGFLPYKKGFYSKECKKSIKSHLIEYFSMPYSIFSLPTYLKMISIDNTRYILYALLEIGYQNENSEIVVYDLGVKNNTFKKICSIKESFLKQKLKEHGQKVDYLDTNELKIIYISALDEINSKDMHLLLITKNGLRIYLTFYTQITNFVEPYMSKYTTCDRPRGEFEIHFVKWPIILPNKRAIGPPGMLMEKKSTIASTQQTRKMINGYLDKNTCMMIDSNDQLTITEDLSYKAIYFYSINLSKIALSQEYENNQKLMENAGTIKLSTDYFYEDLEICKLQEESLISSNVSQLLEIKRNGNLINKEFFLGGKTGSFAYNCLNDLSRQVYLPATHYVFLTSECLDFVLKARPIDILFQILNIINNENNIDEYEFNKFVNCYGGIETCCMLLEIICNTDMCYYFNESLDKKLKEDYFIRIKQNFTKEKNLNNDSRQIIKYIKASEEVIQKAVIVFFKLGDSIPEVKEELNDRGDFFAGYGRILQPEKKRYTYKMEGFLLYFSRLIRPIWNKKIVNKNVFDCLIYDRLENFIEDELQLVRKRVLEIKNFMDSKNDRLLIKNTLNNDSESLKKVDKKNILEFSSYKTPQENIQMGVGSKSNTPQNQPKRNVEEIIWDEKKLMEDYYNFLDRILQTIDLLIFLVVSHNLKTIMNMITEYERNHFMNLTFHELFREIDTEKPIKSLLSAFLKKNFNDSKNITIYFLSHFPHFFNESDSKLSQAEQCFEISLKLASENAIEKDKYISKGLLFLHDNITNVSDERFEGIYKTYLEKMGKFWETIILMVKYLNNLSLLEEGLKLSQKESIDRKQIFANKIDFYLNNITQYKESARNLIINIISRILLTKHNYANKSLFSFAKSSPPDLIKNKSLDDLNILFGDCLKQIFLCQDEILHKKVIRWLFYEKLFDDILAIDSQSIEEVLLEENDQNFKAKYTTLYKYYLNREDHLKASRVATRISLYDQSEMMASENEPSGVIKDFIISEEEIINMEERLKFMNFAIQELENYLHASDSVEKDYTKHIEKKKDLVLHYKHLQIQAKVIEELEEINDETKEYLLFFAKNNENQAVSQKLMKEKTEIDFNISFLNRKVLDLEDLKTNFIEKYGMLACKLLIYDYAENEVANENILKLYENIIGTIYQDTLKTNLWKTNLQRKLKFIYFNLTKKRKKLFPLKQIIYLLENFNQVHPYFSSYQEHIIHLIEKNRSNISSDDSCPSPFWIAEFLNSNLNIRMFELLKIYAKYFNENLDNYEKEIEIMESEGMNVAPNRNIENFIYALNLLLYVIELLLKSVKSNIQILISEAAGKNIIEESQHNIREFNESQNVIEGLLFSCFEKLNVLRKLRQMDLQIIQVLELIIKKLSDDIKKINQEMTLIQFAPLEQENEEKLPVRDVVMKEPQNSYRESSFGQDQELPFLNQSFNFNEESEKKENKFSKYDYTKAPI